VIAEFSATFGTGWGPVTRRKHADDFGRFLRWLDANDIPATTEALDFLVLARYVDDLRRRPGPRRLAGITGRPDAVACCWPRPDPLGQQRQCLRPAHPLHVPARDVQSHRRCSTALTRPPELTTG
jgi:hypothetical protein